MIHNTKIVYKKPIAAILFSAIMVLSIFSGVALADNSDHSNEIPDDYILSSGTVSHEYTATSGTVEEDPFNYQGECVINETELNGAEKNALSHVQKYAKEQKVSPALLMAIIKKEDSSFDPNAIGDGGLAIGYMQLHWDAAYDAGYRSARGGATEDEKKTYAREDWPTDGLDPDTNIKYGCSYLKIVYNQWGSSSVYGDSLKNAISAYNLGRTRGPERSNENSYVNPVLGYYGEYKDKYKCFSLDLIFTIDTTGSMWDDIDYVKASASAIADAILLDIPTARIAVVDYRDFPVWPYGAAGVDYPFYDDLAFSNDKSAIVAAIQGLTLGNGVDWRESVYSALMHSIDSTSLGGWRGSDQAAKVIILMGDAPPHDPEPFTGYTLSSVVTAAYNADPVIIYPIQIGGTVEKFEELADQTGGKAFTAANAEEVVDAILEAIGEIKTKPVADANGPYSGYVGSPITFDGTGSYDLDGMIVSYEWDLDDDGEFDDATGPTPSKTWSTIYSGTISLLVTDDDGEIDTDSTTLTVEEAEDTTPPTIESVTLDAYTTIPDATIHVTVEAADNVGVTSVTADGVTLTKTDGTWEGDVTAPSTTGDYTITIRAEDDAGNFAETMVDYSVVIPTGGLGVAILPKISSASAGSTLPLDIKIVCTENFDDVLHVYLTLDGIPLDYQADLSWFDWIDTSVQAQTGGEIVLPIEVAIPGGTSPGYKSFGVKVESTKWSSEAQDYGSISVS